MRSIVALFALMVLAGQVLHAKCPREEYTVTVVVQEEVSVAGIEGARVFVFVDDHDRADTQGLTGGGGQFSGRFYFDTFRRSSIFGDRCDRAPERIEVLVAKDGYRGVRKSFDSKELGKSRSPILQLGPIKLPPLQLQERQ